MLDWHDTYSWYTFAKNISLNLGLLDKVNNCRDLNELKVLNKKMNLKKNLRIKTYDKNCKLDCVNR